MLRKNSHRSSAIEAKANQPPPSWVPQVSAPPKAPRYPSFLHVALSSDLLCGFLQGKPHENRDTTKFHRKLGDTWVYDRRAKPLLVLGQCRSRVSHKFRCGYSWIPGLAPAYCRSFEQIDFSAASLVGPQAAEKELGFSPCDCYQISCYSPLVGRLSISINRI